MRIQTTITPKAYLSAMKERMGSRLAWGAERFTGCFLGRLFYVTHHAGYEWNRRITNQKNAALGFVKKTKSGSEIRFLTFQSMLCPPLLIPYLLIAGLYLFATFPVMKAHLPAFLLSVLILIGMPPVVTFFESITDGSIEGRKHLLGLLVDPSDYFAYLKHQNEIDRA